MTGDYETVELPQFTRRILVTGGFDADRAGSGVLRPFAGVLGLGMATGDWPMPALAHLTLEPLVADALGESETTRHTVTEETVQRTVVDRASERSVVGQASRGATSDGRTTSDEAAGEPRVRDILRKDADATRTTGDGADDEETFREIVERVSADPDGDRSLAGTTDRDLTGTADRAVPPRMDVARDVDSDDESVRAAGEPTGETGTRDSDATRRTDATTDDATAVDAPGDATDATPGDAAPPAVGSPERPADGTPAGESDVETPIPEMISPPEPGPDGERSEPPEMTVHRNVTRMASDDAGDESSTPDESVGRQTPPGGPDAETGTADGSAGRATAPGGTDDETTFEPATPTVTRSVTRLPDPPSMTVQRSLTSVSTVEGGSDGTPSRPGESSAEGDRSTAASPGAGSPAGTDRVTRTVVTDPVVAGARGADSVPEPGSATSTDGRTEPGTPTGRTGDATGRTGDATGRMADANNRTADATGRTAETTGRAGVPVQSEPPSTPEGMLAPPDDGSVRLEPLNPAGRPTTGSGPRSTAGVDAGSQPDATAAPGADATSSPRMAVRHDGPVGAPDAAEEGGNTATGAREPSTRDGRTGGQETPGRRSLDTFVDIDRVVDRLYRKFERKLRIERERRGL